MSFEPERLARALGHSFREPDLLLAALTHRSFRGKNNERLEFLGDSVLDLVVAETLFHRYPGAREGELSRLRASLVKRTTLAAIASDLSLGGFLRLGSGELKSGGFRRDSILADALEALFGAVYLDAGLDAARECILCLLHARLESLPPAEQLKDPKTRLQEWLQGQAMSVPEYSIERVEGEAHEQRFTVRCTVRRLSAEARGAGSSRQRAEQAAAAKLLDALLSDGAGTAGAGTADGTGPA